MKIASDERVFVCGKTGSGKTHLVKKLILPNIERFVFYDVKCQEVLEDVVICESIDAVKRAMEVGEPRIHFKDIHASTETFDALCQLLFIRGNCALVVDEIARHCSAVSLPKYLDYCIRMGRSRNVGLVLCTQNPNMIHNNLIREAEHFFLFEQTHPNDRAKLRGVIGSPADQLNQLAEFEFVYYSIRSKQGEIFEPI